MRKSNVAIALTLSALLVAAFQNCGKLGFSLDKNDKSDLLRLGQTVPEIVVDGEVPVEAGQDVTLSVVTKHALEASYTCVVRNGSTEIAAGPVDLSDGLGAVIIRVDESLTCTFTARSGERVAETHFDIPVEGDE